MHRVSRWLGIGLVALTVGTTPSAIAGTPGAGTPGAGTPISSPAEVYTYRPDRPVVVIGSGPWTAALRVDRLPTDRYGVVTVATGSDDPFRFTITPPQGETRTVFEADTPDSLTGALLLDRPGDHTLTIAATGSWALIIR